MKRTVKRTDKNTGSIWLSPNACEQLKAGVGSTVYVDGEYPVTVRSLDEHQSTPQLSADVMDKIGHGDKGDVSITTDGSAPKADSIQLRIPSQYNLRGGNIKRIFEYKLHNKDAVRTDDSITLNTENMGDDEFGSSMELDVLKVTPDEAVVDITDETDISFVQQRDSQNTEDDDEKPIVTEGSETDVTFDDIAGLDDEIQDVREMIELPIESPELFQQMNVEPPTGLLLEGPPGTGKTMISKAISNETDASFYNVEGSQITSKHVGVASDKLRELFEEAGENAPAIIFIDELDSIATDRDNSNYTKSGERIVTTLLTQMDGLGSDEDIYVIGATNRADSLDSALRRGGRFDREVEIGVPDEDDRQEIIELHLNDVPMADEVSVEDVVDQTNGFVGADIAAFTQESALNAISRVEDNNSSQLELTMDDIEDALKNVEPSGMREFHVEVPDVTWNDIGGLEETKQSLIAAVEYPLEHSEVYDEYDIDTSHGVLLEGPTGTGKTMLAKAAANESDANFISINGPELFDKYVGETEKEIRKVFERARANAPTIVFFDEIDAVARDRASSQDSSGVGQRLVNQLLSEMDGVEENGDDIVVIGTTNHADSIDDAIRRSGRLSETIHVGIPDTDARREIFQIELDEKPLTDDVDVDELTAKTEGYVGADISEIARQASVKAATNVIDDDDSDIIPISQQDLLDAIEEVQSSVDDEDEESILSP